MKINPRILARLTEAEARHCCLHTSKHNEQQTLSMLVKSGEVTRARQGLYARTAIWESLDANEQYLWTLRGLHEWHPDWVFAAISVISAYRVEHPYWLHNDAKVFLATDKLSGAFSPKGVQYVHTENFSKYRQTNISMTSVPQALCDCAMRYKFHEVLPMFDSALRKQLTCEQDIRAISEKSHRFDRKVAHLLNYTDPKSENGGESICRAIMIEEGFGKPELQREFRIPVSDGTVRIYRVDMLYNLTGKELIAVEFDGMDKYVNPMMTNQRSIREVVHEEKERENLLLTKTPIRKIVRIDFNEAMQRVPLVEKLSAAGLPRARPLAHQ
ncbi:hypothetical protein OZX67_02320 [Bifidobacterium sp. ESL0728]|uniref:hypothetical protein n=1 Tax=Bifidobacterium sp. ESL0728 TaxID=2983220 RepID=UPI0023F64A72|nr:hypothetical protein [Bifidobacterium sp. ESL0728]WEV59412.1 hypothetical protein OZX67_02320 [Bifidobacterium sp. ESL0728]